MTVWLPKAWSLPQTPPTFNSPRSLSKMSAMEVDTPPPAAAAAKKKGGKDDGKKRFEVKKVRSLAHISFRLPRALTVSLSGMPWHYGHGVSTTYTPLRIE
jgi:hypothetical protein